jgi:hypothetical protein
MGSIARLTRAERCDADERETDGRGDKEGANDERTRPESPPRWMRQHSGRLDGLSGGGRRSIASQAAKIGKDAKERLFDRRMGFGAD